MLEDASVKMVDLAPALANCRIYSHCEMMMRYSVKCAFVITEMLEVNFDNAAFRGAMSKFEMSLDEMAAQRALLRRLVASYRKGNQFLVI